MSKQAIIFFFKLLNIQTQIRHTGRGKKAKKNKRTGTSIQDTRVGEKILFWIRASTKICDTGNFSTVAENGLFSPFFNSVTPI